MTKCSCYAYRENLVKECHNKKTGISEKETAALMEKISLMNAIWRLLKHLGVWNMLVKAILCDIWSIFIQQGTKIQTLQRN